MNVLVLRGGKSAEREVSLRSGAAVADAATRADYGVTVADPADQDFDLAALTAKCDVVLPILHGAGGEDGVLQKQLEALGKPFMGSSSAACALTFDKSEYRDFVIPKGVRMAEGAVVDRAGFDATPLRRQPYVLKPINGGSTVDTVILHDLTQEPESAFFDELFSRYPQMLLEQLIEGREITVGVLGDQALPVILIVPPAGGQFDYENKYNGKTQEIMDPSQVPVAIKQKAQELALHVHQLTGCRHLSRTDMIVTPTGELYVLETNTLPGMTDQSLFPKAAAAVGYDMPALVKHFVEMAQKV